MKLSAQFYKSFAVAKKSLRIYYLKGPVLIFGIILPLFLFLSFMIGRNLPVEFLIPGLTGMVLFFSSTAITPMIAPWETRMKTFERLVSSPISLSAILFGDVIASMVFGISISMISLMMGCLLIGSGIITLELVAGTVLAAFCFSALGLILSAPPTDTPSTIMMLSSLLKFPMIFISGIFIPLGEMSEGIKLISFSSPLTYYTDLARNSIQGESYFFPSLDLFALTIFGILFFMIAVKWHKKSLEKRF